MEDTLKEKEALVDREKQQATEKDKAEAGEKKGEEKKKEDDKKKEEKKDEGEKKEEKPKKVEVKDIGSLLAALAALTFDRGTRDDDAVDRFNHMFMYAVLMVFAGTTAMNQFVGDPIQCWVPAQYKEDYFKDYVKSHCWIHPMYNVDFKDVIPVNEQDRYYNDVSFYRWITVFFIMIGFLFRVPQILWKQLKNFTGANLDKIIAMASDTVFLFEEKKEVKLRQVTEFLHRYLTRPSHHYGKGRVAMFRRTMENSLLFFGKRSGRYLVATYIFIKVLYLANAVGQFFLISWFIKSNFWSFGESAMSTFFQEGKWENTYTFPRVGMCDFHIRQLQNVQTHTVQCVLSINLFIEKMFLVVWFGLILAIIANAISLVKWVYELVFQSKTRQFLMTYSSAVIVGGRATREDKKEFSQMVRGYLKPDGVFLLKMIAINTSDLVVIDLLRHILARYREYVRQDENSGRNFQLNRPMTNGGQ